MNDNDNKSGLDAGVLRYAGRALRLVWSTNRLLTVSYGLLTLLGGLIPAAIAFVGQLIIDAVVDTLNTGAPLRPAVMYIGVEAILVVFVATASRGMGP